MEATPFEQVLVLAVASYVTGEVTVLFGAGVVTTTPVCPLTTMFREA